MAKTDPLDTAAAALLRALKDGGVDTFLVNAGTDTAPIIEALAAGLTDAGEAPDAYVIHHESVAMGMAHGYHSVSGRVAAVMVHVNVGLANAAMAALNASAARVPLILLSGRTPISEWGRPGARNAPIHWGQEMADQGALVREAVRWEYELRTPEQAAPAVARALAIAQRVPAGPVHLSLPREILAEPVKVDLPDSLRARGPAPSPTVPMTATLEAAAATLANAKRPLIIVQRVPISAAEPLARLAVAAALPVVEYWASTNLLPTDHPCHAGFDPGLLAGEADVILTLDALAPFPAAVPSGARIISLGPDPLATDTPYRGFATDIALTGDTTATLSLLADLVEHRTPADVLAERRAIQEERHRNLAAARRKMGEALEEAPLDHARVGRILSETVDPDALIFSELGVPAGALDLAGPGRLFWMPLAGGLGWGLPAALGGKLARPEATVIATVGDGSYLFSNPAACHQVSTQHGLPILTIVMSNGHWRAVTRAVASMYPDGRALARNEVPLTHLGPRPDHAAAARAYGAWAARVDTPEELRAALRDALSAVRNGQSALIDVTVA